MDTRSWKSKIVGSSKGKKKQVLITKGKNKGKYKTITDNKIETLEYVKNNLGIDTKGDDDIADAICISKYGFLPKSLRNLKLETSLVDLQATGFWPVMVAISFIENSRIFLS